MTDKPFTARNVSKFIVTSIVASQVSDSVATAVYNYTEIQEDNLVVEIGSKVVGWGVADRVRPYTDKIVDTTADFITSKREARKAKKNTKKEEEK